MTEWNEYKNAPARPHNGDSVDIDSDKTNRLKEDIGGIVQGKSTTVSTEEMTIRVRTSIGTHPFPREAITLTKADEPRFDDYNGELLND